MCIFPRLTPHVEWYDQCLAGSQDFPISQAEELLLVRYAPTTPICAVALNQLSIKNHCIMFVSPEHYCLTKSNLRSLRESPTSGRRLVSAVLRFISQLKTVIHEAFAAYQFHDEDYVFKLSVLSVGFTAILALSIRFYQFVVT